MVDIWGLPKELDNGTDNSPTRPPYYTRGIREIQREIVTSGLLLFRRRIRTGEPMRLRAYSFPYQLSSELAIWHEIPE